MNFQDYTPQGHELSGVALFPPEGNQVENIVLFLHGYGANGSDLLSIGKIIHEDFPNTLFVAPDAPGRLPFGANSRFWFPLTSEVREEDVNRGAQQMRPLVLGYIEQILAEFSLPSAKLLIVGFSQGGMMALEVGFRMHNDASAIMSFSGALAGPERLASEICARPRAFLSHGRIDPVVPFDSMAAAEAALLAENISVETMARAVTGHWIDGDGVAAIRLYTQDLQNQE